MSNMRRRDEVSGDVLDVLLENLSSLRGAFDSAMPVISIRGFADMFASVADGPVKVRTGRNFCSVEVPLRRSLARGEVSEFARAANAHVFHHDGDAGTLLMQFAFRARNDDPLPCGDWEGAPVGVRLRAALKQVKAEDRHSFAAQPWLEVREAIVTNPPPNL